VSFSLKVSSLVNEDILKCKLKLWGTRQRKNSKKAEESLINDEINELDDLE
jgi:hypothetical protein